MLQLLYKLCQSIRWLQNKVSVNESHWPAQRMRMQMATREFTKQIYGGEFMGCYQNVHKIQTSLSKKKL